MKKQNTVTVLKPNKELFADCKVGINSFQALKHKNGQPYTDIEYMELLGRHCLKKEEKGEAYIYDKTTVNVAKEIVRGRDELGMTTAELTKYLNACLAFE